MIDNKADKIIETFFQLVISKYEIGLEMSVKDTDFVLECHLLC